MTNETEAVAAENQEASDNENQSLLNPTVTEESTEENVDVEESSINHLTSTDDEEPTVKAAEEEKEKKEAAEKPENVIDAHWDKDKGEIKIDELSKSYQELRNKMATGKHKPPKDGQYKTDFVEGLEPDDPMMTDFVEIAKDNNMSQELLEQLTGFYLKSQEGLEEQIVYKQKEELQKLGNNSEAIIKSTNNWLGKFQTSGTLAKEEVEAIANASTNAAFISGLNKIRRSYGEQTIPTATTQEVDTTTMADIETLMADKRYGVDANFTKSVEKKVYELHGEKY
jgi:hypothetical protein|tara:strand:- start:7177 stop:8025 length:849 start_codon:yes stop_codon:yes gene_type:complete